MASPLSSRPGADEYNPYYTGYVARVREGEDVVDALGDGFGEVLATVGPLTEEQAGHRYAAGKWSIREVIGHLADTERIMAYRALRVARGDSTPLPGFDENLYVANAGADRRPMRELLADLAAVRQATLTLVAGIVDDPDAWARRGVANDFTITPRALVHIIVGHQRHHLAVLRERYLEALPGAGAPPAP